MKRIAFIIISIYIISLLNPIVNANNETIKNYYSNLDNKELDNTSIIEELNIIQNKIIVLIWTDYFENTLTKKQKKDIVNMYNKNKQKILSLESNDSSIDNISTDLEDTGEIVPRPVINISLKSTMLDYGDAMKLEAINRPFKNWILEATRSVNGWKEEILVEKNTSHKNWHYVKDQWKLNKFMNTDSLVKYTFTMYEIDNTNRLTWISSTKTFKMQY